MIPSLAKIGKRYYWVLWSFPPKDSDGWELVRHVDGFADTREEAADALAIELEKRDPGAEQWLQSKPWAPPRFNYIYARNRAKGRNWARAYAMHHGQTAHDLYKKHHVRKREAKFTNAQPELGFIYGWSRWRPHRITKITKKRIFILDDYDRQRSLDREKLEKDGRVWSGGGFFYTEAGKLADEYRRANGSKPEHLTVLGLELEHTRADILKAFRKKSKTQHPDRGGDAADFRRLVEAKDRALCGLRAA